MMLIIIIMIIENIVPLSWNIIMVMISMIDTVPMWHGTAMLCFRPPSRWGCWGQVWFSTSLGPAAQEASNISGGAKKMEDMHGDMLLWWYSLYDWWWYMILLDYVWCYDWIYNVYNIISPLWGYLSTMKWLACYYCWWSCRPPPPGMHKHYNSGANHILSGAGCRPSKVWWYTGGW